MTLKAKTEPDALKRIAWLEDTILPDDYDVIHEGETVERVASRPTGSCGAGRTRTVPTAG